MKPEEKRLSKSALVSETGLMNKHASRRLETRNSLLAAARQLVDAGRLSTFTVEDVCAIAGISRAGFYLHFAGKAALLDAQQQQVGDWYVRQFRKLDRAVVADEDLMLAWLKRFAGRFGDARHGVQLFNGRRDEPDGLGSNFRDEAFRAIGEQLPESGLLRDDGTFDAERRIEALLLLFQLERLSIHLAIHRPTDAELHLRILARHFRAVLGRGTNFP